MHLLRKIVLLSCVAALSACIKFGDGTTTTTVIEPGVEGASLGDLQEQAEFERKLSEAGVPFKVEVRDGDRYASWSGEHSAAANQVKASVIGQPLPSGRNIAFSPPERQEEFKAWLKENSIPYTVQVKRGREYVIWDETNAARVKSWKHFGPSGHEAPNPSIERDVQGLSPSAAPHVKR